MKKITLHYDALITVLILFIASFSFNFYQRYQYSDLLHEHIAIQKNRLTMELSLAMLESSLDKCENNLVDEN